MMRDLLGVVTTKPPSANRHGICEMARVEVWEMKSHYLRKKLGRIVLALSFLISIGVLSATTAQAQWPFGRDQNQRDNDRDYRRHRSDRQDGDRRYPDYNRDRDYQRNGDYRNDRYNQNVSQIAVNDGYRDGVYTGQRDGQRGQNYDPQRSHFYRNGHGDNGSYSNNGRYGGGYQYEQAYRQGFVRGYNEGYRQYSRNNRGNRNGNSGRWPFPW
jgi:hypothetical protein